MEDELVHEIELYPLESFRTLLDHEVNRSRRYKQPLTLIHIKVNAEPDTSQTQHSAEVFAINVLNLQVRETDIPCKKDGEFLVLMPATDEQGGRVACQRLEKLFEVPHQTYDRVSFRLSAFIGMASTSGDETASSDKLMQEASVAMHYAQGNHVQSIVSFSEIT